jgi:hypothetical protein
VTNRDINIRAKVLSLTVFSIFLMYLKILPIPVETQPFIFVFLSFISLYVLKDDLCKLSRDRFYCVVLLLVLTIYLLPSLMLYGAEAVVDYVKYIISPLCYLCISKGLKYVRIQYFHLISFIILIYIVFFYFGGEAFQSIIKMFMERLHFGAKAAILSPEPSYFAFFAMLILAYLDFLSVKDKKSNITLISKAIVIFACLTTGSALVYLILLLYLSSHAFYHYKEKFLKSIFIASPFVVLLVFLLLRDENSRFYQLMQLVLVIYDGDIDIFTLAFRTETSGSSRVILNYMAIATPFTIDFFGVGLGGYKHMWPTVAQNLNIPIQEHEVLGNMGLFSAQTYFANLVADTGVLALPFLLILFTNNRKIKVSDDILMKSNFLFIKLSLLICLLFQSQITNPIPWVLLGLLKNYNYNQDCKGL